MNSIISLLISVTSSALAKFLTQVLMTVREVFKYLNAVRQDKKEKESKQELIDYKKKMEDVVDNGSLDDLLNLRR